MAILRARKNAPPPPASAVSSDLIGLRRGVTLLIEGIGRHAPVLDPEAGERFQRKLFECQRLTREARRLEEILPILEALGASLSDCVTDAHTRAAEMRQQHAAIVGLLNEELVKHGVPQGVQDSLRQLEAELNCANTLGDLQLVRQHLQSALRGKIAGVAGPGQSDENAWKWDASESPTGFPGPAQATEHLSHIFGTDPHYYVMLVRLPLLLAVERLYGSETSSEYLNSAAQYLTNASATGDNLFHWSHDVIMNVTRRNQSPDGIRHEMSRLTGGRRGEVIEVKERRIIVANPMLFELHTLSQYSTVQELLTSFEPFVTGDKQAST